MGLNPANINPANIRVVGNGANTLPENNATPLLTDLTENAIFVSDNGDSKFDNGEFAAFYAVGPIAWKPDTLPGRFTHQKNIYTDTGYYFVTFDQGAGLRIAQQSAPAAGNTEVTTMYMILTRSAR